MTKKTVVIGASIKPSRFSYHAIKQLVERGCDILAIGQEKGTIFGVPIITEMVQVENVDTVTLYLNAKNQKGYYKYIIDLKPQRIIFNPGSENEELMDLADKNNIHWINACTLNMISFGDY